MEKKIVISKDGPYILEGNIPLREEIVVNDKEGNPLKYKDGKKIDKRDSYALCRCGKSCSKPYCDGSHTDFFDGKLTAKNEDYKKSCDVYEGPLINLGDKEEICSGAGFCHRKGGTWDLANKNDSASKDLAICQCANCPSGRLVAIDKKTGKDIEPKLDKSISLIEHSEDGFSGPISVKGGIL
jgi:CDGSH-type Zn-finger protein